MSDTTLRRLKSVRFSTRLIGREILWVRRTESTNDLAWREHRAGGEDGLVVLAEEQTAGRGRMGRTWECPAESGILCSVLLRPGLPPDRAPLVTVIGALAVRDTAVTVADADATIRWPNDVLIGGRKVAGVLVESRSSSESDRPVYVLGIGLNVCQQEEDFPSELRTTSTSLGIAAGRDLDRLAAARRLLEALDEWYARLMDGRGEEIAAAWRQASSVLHQRVTVREGGETHRGTIEDLDPCEGIFLRLDRGGIRQIRGEHVEELRLI